MIIHWLGGIYLLAAAGLAVFGMLGLVTMWFYWKHRHYTDQCPDVPDSMLPTVTVQLPIFNERFVVERLIRSAVALSYPRDRLQIQVVDDSEDDTTEIASRHVEYYRDQGYDIELLHRENRKGFKAGGLEAALGRARGEFIAVFDADFKPDPDFLLQTVPHFLHEPDLGMIQTRWGHINPGESELTAAQSIALDKHFAMEQTVRHRANLFPKFNGSAGVWRRRCLVDAGGWEDDTVCEDLCLSTRAVLKGWRFRYLNRVVAPAELPTSISAYKNQQSRWAKGSTQCLVKYGPSIISSRRHSPVARTYALVSMAGYTTHLLMLILLLVQVPLIYLGYRPPAVLLLFGLAGLAQPLLFVMGQRSLYRDWWRRLAHLPALLLVAIGLAPSNSRAILTAVAGMEHDFVRTPKGRSAPDKDNSKGEASQVYHLPFDWIVVVELLLAVYAMIGLALSIGQGNYGPLFFMAICALGFGYVAIGSLGEHIARIRPSISPK